MQPYFFPYAGYYSLLAHVDEFVIFDCVQFRRRGRIHRAEVPGPAGQLQWLTLPIAHAPRETLIRNIQFAAHARNAFDERVCAVPWIHTASGPGAPALREYLMQPLDDFIRFLEDGLQLAAGLLQLGPRISRSSALGIPPEVHGQARVLAVVQALGARRYINLPGGQDLYQATEFARHDVQLEFLPEYHGRHSSMLHSMMTGDLQEIREEILRLVPKPAR